MLFGKTLWLVASKSDALFAIKDRLVMVAALRRKELHTSVPTDWDTGAFASRISPSLSRQYIATNLICKICKLKVLYVDYSTMRATLLNCKCEPVFGIWKSTNPGQHILQPCGFCSIARTPER